MCNRVTVRGNKFSPFLTFAICATIAYKFSHHTYSEFIVKMVEHCRPLLQQIAKHGDCFEHIQSNRVHNTDLKHSQTFARHSHCTRSKSSTLVKKLAKCVYKFLQLVLEPLSIVPRMSKDI